MHKKRTLPLREEVLFLFMAYAQIIQRFLPVLLQSERLQRLLQQL